MPIPQSQNSQNAALMQQMMMSRGQAPSPQDQLMQALGQQSLQGEAMKTTADYKMKMLKLKMKGGGMQQPGQQQGPPAPAGMAGGQ